MSSRDDQETDPSSDMSQMKPSQGSCFICTVLCAEAKSCPCGLISHTRLDCTLDLLKQIEGLPKIPCLVSMRKCVLLYNAWETSSPNHTPMIMMLNVTLQCFTFTTRAYPNTSRAAVKKYIKTVHAAFLLIVWILCHVKGMKGGKLWKPVTEAFVVI